MLAEDLRKAVLQAAIQGKLVPQDTNDEPASVLLEHIRKEKEQLIKDKKIKKEKPLEPISEDEITLDIPESWEWVRMGTIVKKLTDGSHNPPPNTGEGYPVISAKNIKTGKVTFDNVDRFTDEKGFMKENPRTNISYGDIIMGIIGGSIGNLAVYNHHEKVIAQRSIAIINSLIHNDYMMMYLKSPQLQGILGKKTNGTAQGGIYLGELKNMLVPLPSISEQYRIVAKVEELMAKIDEFEKIENELESIKKAFPNDMRKSFLQAAIQGKLTEQLPIDSSVDELLENIRRKKDQLVNQKKIKNGKPLAPITEDEIPFDIPENWRWVRLNQLGDIVGGGTPKTEKAEFWDNGTIPWLTPADMKNVTGKYVSSGERYITEQGLAGSSARVIPKDSVVYSSRAPIGYIAIAQNNICTNQGFKSVVPYVDGLELYLYYCLIARTPEIINRASGTTFKEISGNEFGMTVIPIPPLEEQKRIVQKLEKLLPCCETLTE